MDLRQLDALVAIADHGTFSAAARALHTVQSNVSAHVARLERELGVTLFDRAHGVLTDEGELVVDRARRMQRELDSVRADLAALDDRIVGGVRIGVIGSVGRWLVPRLLDRLSDRHPGIDVVVVDASTTSLLPQLVQGGLDLALLNLPINDPSLVTERLFDEDRIVIAPTTHPLAAHDHLTLAEVSAHPLVLEPRGTAFRDELDAEATAEGIELVTKAEVDGMRLVATLAFEGFGPAIVPATAAPEWREGPWRRIALDDVAARSVGIARRRADRLAAPARALLDELQVVLPEVAGDKSGVHLF